MSLINKRCIIDDLGIIRIGTITTEHKTYYDVTLDEPWTTDSQFVHRFNIRISKDDINVTVFIE